MKVVHYINQFFAGIGGEEEADVKPSIQEGCIGPALALNAALNGAEVTHTIICGDNYMGSNTEEAIKTILGFLDTIEFDIFVAGPAFQAGRYGVACGAICTAVKDKYGVPVFSSMHPENPGVEMYKKNFHIFIGGKSAAKMRSDIAVMANYINKVIQGVDEISRGGALENHYYPRGVRHQVWLENKKTAAERGVEMLIKKLNGEPFETELVIPRKELVPIAEPVNLKNACIAMVTTGGIVPVDNPDRIQSASATRWGRYDIGSVDTILGGEYKTIHAGFDPAAADHNPNVIMPIDAMKAYEKEGKYGSLHPYFYSTVGTGTTEVEAKRMANEIIPLLKEDGVNSVIMTST